MNLEWPPKGMKSIPNLVKIGPASLAFKYSDTSANEDNSFRNHIR